MKSGRAPIAIGRRAALFVGVLALLAAACDGLGQRSPLARARVVSLTPSTTEAVFAIGAGDLLVGRSRYCDYPPEALALPAVGGFADPSLEAIVALAPTLVIGARGPAGPSIEQALRAHSIATYFPETESIAQIEGSVTELGRLLAHEDGARAVVASIQARVDGVARAVSGRPKVRAVLVFDVAPIFVAGPGSFPDELLRLAGGENAISTGGAYPTIGLEHLLALDPDVLLDGSTEGHPDDPTKGLAALRAAPGFRDLRAVREGRVRTLDTSAALRPGPRIGDGLAAIARALHGESLPLAPDGAKAR